MDFLNFLKGDVCHDRCEAERRLVEHQQTWLQHQAASDSEHLLFPTAHGSGGLLSALSQHRKNAENEFKRAATLSLGAGNISPDLEVFLHRHFGEHLTALGYMSNAELRDLVGRQRSDVCSQKADRTRGQPYEA